MAKINLTEGFSLIPKGIHVFQITEVKYNEDFGKMEIIMKISTGQKHTERFTLLDKDGEPNEGALNAFSYFAKVAFNDFSLKAIEHEDLVGHFIRCEVDHEEVESNRNPGKMVKFVRLGDKEPADGFDDEPCAPATTPAPETKKSAKTSVPTTQTKNTSDKKHFDLDSILG